jgi:DnaJ-class molecular chaperone
LSSLPPLEIQALAKILDELDYYQVLHLEHDATQSDVKKAYFQTSRSFHPDANRHLGEDLLSHCVRISKRVTEAYCVLRDPRRRKAYDEHLETGGNARMQLSEAKAAHAKAAAETRQGKTPQGRQYFSKATSDMQRDDYTSAINNLQMALTFERGNPLFEEKLAEAKQRKKDAAAA